MKEEGAVFSNRFSKGKERKERIERNERKESGEDIGHIAGMPRKDDIHIYMVNIS